MSEALSQEEIDAILKGSSSVAAVNESETISEEHQALSEICNISTNVISDFLFSKLKEKVSIISENVSNVDVDNFVELSEELYAFEVELKGDIPGKTIFVFKMNDVRVINDLLLGGDGTSTDDIMDVQTVLMLETMQDILPDFVASIASVVEGDISSLPAVNFSTDNENSKLKELVTNSEMLKVNYSLEIGNIINSQFFQLFPQSLAKDLVDLLLNGMKSKIEESNHNKNAKNPQKVDRKNDDNRRKNKDHKDQPISIQSVSFPSFDDNEDFSEYDENIEFILDVPLRITVELGSTQKAIKDILNLNVGSIVELDNLVDDYVDILVNGKLIACGEVIVVDEKFGVRIMELYTNNQKSILNDQ